MRLNVGFTSRLEKKGKVALSGSIQGVSMINAHMSGKDNK